MPAQQINLQEPLKSERLVVSLSKQKQLTAFRIALTLVLPFLVLIHRQNTLDKGFLVFTGPSRVLGSGFPQDCVYPDTR